MDDIVSNIVLTADCIAGPKADYDDLNTDVIVQFENGEKYIATFFSFKNLKNMIGDVEQEYATKPAYQYYKILNMVLVKDFNQGNLRPVIEAMILEGDFQLIFQKI